MTNPIESSMQLLDVIGYFRVILPMILIFAIFYALLLKTNVLGKYKDDAYVKGLAALISFAISFLVVKYTPVVDLLNTLIPTAALLLVIVLLIFIILAFIGVPIGEEGAFGEKKWLWVIPAIIIIVIFLGLIDFAAPFDIPGIHEMVQAFSGGLPPININQETVNLIIAISIFAILPIIIIAIVIGKAKDN